MTQQLNFDVITSGYGISLMVPHTTTAATQLDFESLFKENFRALHAYAITILRDEAMAEEIVQQVFCKLWERRDSLKIEVSYTAYLYRAVYNDCLNHLKHLKVRAAHHSHALRQSANSHDTDNQVGLRELQARLEAALKTLPEGCRTIFQMSRYESLKYHEIAERLDISPKTVEAQMGKALKLLRVALADYLPTLLICLFTTLIHFIKQ